jgi:UDPglucose--hexose-1-phosphate uridylyltransferase
MSEIRYDQLYDTHVIISPERLHRPDALRASDDVIASDQNCPFCEGHEAMTPPEIYAIRGKQSYPNEPGWQTRVVPNLYKAVQIEAEHRHHTESMQHYWEGFGAHEVIIDSPEHHTRMTQMSEYEIAEWLKTLRARVADLRRDGRIKHISIFKNQGVLAGSTQSHTHTQLIALPIVPKADLTYYRRSYEYRQRHKRTLMDAILEEEQASGKRIIAQRGGFVAFCPFASAYPFEVMIAASDSAGQLDTLSDHALGSLSGMLEHVLKNMQIQLGDFDFNLSVGTPPLDADVVKHAGLDALAAASRFFIRIMPRLYRHGGFEASTGMIINPVAPEMAAKLIKEAQYV